MNGVAVHRVAGATWSFSSTVRLDPVTGSWIDLLIIS